MFAQFLTIPLETLINQIPTSSRFKRDTAQVNDTGFRAKAHVSALQAVSSLFFDFFDQLIPTLRVLFFIYFFFFCVFNFGEELLTNGLCFAPPRPAPVALPAAILFPELKIKTNLICVSLLVISTIISYFFSTPRPYFCRFIGTPLGMAEWRVYFLSMKHISIAVVSTWVLQLWISIKTSGRHTLDIKKKNKIPILTTFWTCITADLGG